jgi:lipopolysaccharide biosynthesis glycosyltransferase
MTKIIYLCIILIVLLFFIKKKRGKEYFLNNDFKIVMFLTEGLNKEAENCIQTLKNLNLDTKLVVTALDDNAYNYISNLGIKTLKKNTNLQKEADFGTKDFYEITYNKLEIIKNSLINYKKIILYSDSDIVFLKDISKDIDKFRKSKYDMMIQDDSPNFNNSENLCTGFMIFKPNNKCIRCLELAMKIMKDNWDTPCKLAVSGGADQRAINLAMKDINIKVGILDLKEYPNGARYFNNITSIYKSFKPKIVHNNYIIGTKNKIKRFKKNNLWFI